MKRLFFALVSCLIYSSMALAQVPDWVSSHPISDKEYIGIGVASLSLQPQKTPAHPLVLCARRRQMIPENTQFLMVVFDLLP